MHLKNKKTTLSPINPIMTNESYEKDQITPNIKFIVYFLVGSAKIICNISGF